uniref:Peroxisomal membrane protein PEX14-like KPWE domain-containing protein n=1 Tax=Sinocyclocheilus rhinocerous TaxID=307959 RepID=A0A673G7D7_9TELE
HLITKSPRSDAAREREADAIAEPPSLSFPEVFSMIQAGEEVPGLQKLDIKPCHDQPTQGTEPPTAPRAPQQKNGCPLLRVCVHGVCVCALWMG